MLTIKSFNITSSKVLNLCLFKKFAFLAHEIALINKYKMRFNSGMLSIKIQISLPLTGKMINASVLQCPISVVDTDTDTGTHTDLDTIRWHPDLN